MSLLAPGFLRNSVRLVDGDQRKLLVAFSKLFGSRVSPDVLEIEACLLLWSQSFTHCHYLGPLYRYPSSLVTVHLVILDRRMEPIDHDGL